MSVTVISTTETPKETAENLAKVEASRSPAPEPVEVSEVPEVEAKADTEIETAEAEALAEDDKELKAKEEGAEKPEGKNRFKKRIDRERAIAAKAKEEMEFWKQEALKSKAGAAAPEPTPVKTKVEVKADGEPTSDQFDTHAEYVKAMANYTYKQNKLADAAVAKEAELKSEQVKKVNEFVERKDKFASEHADFHQAIEDINDIPMSLAVQYAVLNSKNGPELMYALAKNREEYKRICAMDPPEAAEAIGEFKATFLKAAPSTETKEQKITKAPKPINPVGTKGAGSAKKTIFDAGLSQSEYEAMRREQIKSRGANA